MPDKKLLTRSEFQVMAILWNLPEEGGFTKDILSKFEDHKPAYTTLATFLKILTDKGFVNTNKKGSMLYFTPKVSREEYSTILMRHAMKHLHHNSPVEMMSFMATHIDFSNEELDQMIAFLNELKAERDGAES